MSVAARYTQEFLRTRDQARPFVAFCSFPGPHSPWLVPEEFGIRYAIEDVPLWPNWDDTFEGKPLNQKKLRLFDYHRNPHVRDPEQLRALLAVCFAYLELIDGMLGEVVATLKELGEYDRTAIVFTADHGDMARSHGFLSKGAYMYDEIYRIPLLFKRAGSPAPGRSTALVHLMDVTATVAHLMAGEEQTTLGAETLHGRSLLPLVHGDTAGSWDREVMYVEYHGDWFGHYSSRMVTDGRWKLVLNFSDLGELYDLEADPHKLVNRYYDPAMRAVRRRYHELLRSEAQRLDDGQAEYYTTAVEEDLGSVIGGPVAFPRVSNA